MLLALLTPPAFLPVSVRVVAPGTAAPARVAVSMYGDRFNVMDDSDGGNKERDGNRVVGGNMLVRQAPACMLPTPRSRAEKQSWSRLAGDEARPAEVKAGQDVSVADDDVEDTTRRWIDSFIIRLGLCPFASKPFLKEQIRYSISEATGDEDLLLDFFVEGQLLLDVPKEEIATTMLMAPHYEGDIEAFYALYVWLTDLLESGDEPILGDQVQPAFFHPEWTFAGVPADSAVHYEKRAPYATINLLRRTDLNDVVNAGLEVGRVINREIAEHNEAELERTGEATLSKLFAGLHTASSASRSKAAK